MSNTAPAKLVFSGAMRTMLLLVIWLVASEAARDGLVIGGLAALFGAAVSLKILPPGTPSLNLLRFVILWPGFIARSLRAGADVAWRALHPGLPIRPGWITRKCALPEGPLRTLFGAEISLLPGTLSAGTKQGCLCVHQLDRREDIDDYLTSRESDLARAFSVSTPRKGAGEDD